VTSGLAPFTLSAEDTGRVEEIQRLTQAGSASIGPLIELLGVKSWAVRRAVVAALARIGAPAAGPLCAFLAAARHDESRLAAAMDALVQASGDVDAPVLALATESNVPAVVCDAVQVLGRRKSGSAIPALAKLAAHSDDNVAVAAMEALGRIGGSTAIEPLVIAVRTRNFFRAFPAIDVLGNSGDPRVIAPLAELLSDPVYADEATAALGRSGQVAAVSPLADALSASSPLSVGGIARALLELRNRYAAHFVDVTPILCAFRDKVSSGVAATRILAAIDNASVDERVACACILGWISDPRVVTKLVALLNAEAPVAAEATKSLRVIGPIADNELLRALQSGDSAQRLCLIPLVPAKRSSVTALVACLTDGDSSVRSQACVALGRIGDASAVPALFPAIGDVDARVSQSAVAAIQSLGCAETEAMAIAAAGSQDARTRRAALRIISYFGYPAALQVLLSATTADSERIRDAATQGLAFLDDPRALEGLLRLAEAPSAQTRAAAVRALGQTSAMPRVVLKLRNSLRDVDAWVRYYGCQALSRLGASDCVADIARLTETDPAGQVRVAAVEATARLGGAEARLMLERAAESGDADVRRVALTGLGSIRRVESIPVLLRALASDDAATRLVTLSALDRLDAPEAFDAIVRAMGDSDANVRSAAMTLMEQRADVRATRWLFEQLRDESRRDWALRALSLPRERRLEELLTALENADAVLAPLLVTVLTRMRRADGDAAVVSVLTFESVFARRAAAAALASVSTAEAREALRISSQADADEDVRKISAAAFA
jgi:HEAT repeat protein